MKIIGHRGAKGLAPENTLRSIEKALQHNVDQIELDVHVTADGKTVLLHDPYLTDAAGNKLVIAEHTFAELQQHKSDLTGLAEAIQLVNKRVPMLIEIKPGQPVELVCAMLGDFLTDGWKLEDFYLVSFDYEVLKQAHRHLPGVAIVVNETWSGTRAAWRARQLGTKRLNMSSTWLWIGFLRPMHKRGYQIAPYTMNDPAKVRRWKPYLYGVITDYPDLFEK